MKLMIFVLIGASVVTASFPVQAEKGVNSITTTTIALNSEDQIGSEQLETIALHSLPIPNTIYSAPTRQVLYSDLEPNISPPTEIILHDPLPYVYCEELNQFVFIYPSESGIQYYRLRPDKRESYSDLFKQVITGSRFPWALRLHGSSDYFVNTEPEAKGHFDYRVPVKQFEGCRELAKIAQYDAGQ